MIVEADMTATPGDNNLRALQAAPPQLQICFRRVSGIVAGVQEQRRHRQFSRSSLLRRYSRALVP